MLKAKVLFLCTGNYYRSRFAELLFNHWAAAQGLAWVADSRALALELGVNNVGPISPYAVAGLQARGIPFATEHRLPQQVTDADLQAATLVIALDRNEHQRYSENKLFCGLAVPAKIRLRHTSRHEYTTFSSVGVTVVMKAVL